VNIFNKTIQPLPCSAVGTGIEMKSLVVLEKD